MGWVYNEKSFLLKFIIIATYYVLYISLLSQAGMQAVRENRYIILSKDFEKAYKKAIKKDDTEHDFYK